MVYTQHNIMADANRNLNWTNLVCTHSNFTVPGTVSGLKPVQLLSSSVSAKDKKLRSVTLLVWSSSRDSQTKPPNASQGKAGNRNPCTENRRHFPPYILSSSKKITEAARSQQQRRGQWQQSSACMWQRCPRHHQSHRCRLCHP